ncbi:MULTISPECIES: succinate dehydrogenase cytochrome b subunit [Myroides]|uniref:Succinate dehydrogenase n=1 Tax=Myroides albus TaxID=2562892 RepID=A0A6I3LIX1_9FLAO|nr:MULTISPECIES: succinate dehydrogenase cytochrome b subunit [Myroides]MTG97536.1 succinate dehydrogenase [Myroides albus]MVX35060.1 succinate dehydrogenase [Myroides sp. LoEW2-1]UVD81187.1 succinate dehydrogenase cytochrome b subunit [Myroides albus]
MAKSALLKSSLAKKYWMALTGLFLCLFLVGHLAGNLQLIFGDASAFNEYALFMTTNPAVKVLSYVTYISILFHAIDGIVLTIQNKKARPIGYAKNNAAANSSFSSRNMAVLGTLLLVFIVTHMVNFWAKMHFTQMPLQTIEVKMEGQKPLIVYKTVQEQYIPVEAVDRGQVELKGTKFYQFGTDLKVADGYKDLHKITIEFFKDPSYGIFYTIGYVLAMIVLGFHLSHGFASAFQSLGINNPRYNGVVKGIGYLFAYLVPALFAIIPLYIYFIK